MNFLQRYLQDFVHLIYPKLCLACLVQVPMPNHILCVNCEYELAPSTLHLERENEVVQKFWGRIQITAGAAMYVFTKTGKVQRLIHQLKYKGKKEVGLHLGRVYGRLLAASPLFQNIDIIVPVPLHPKKLKLRGYNQCDYFAEGLSETSQIPWNRNGLKRIIHSKSQTKKTREERFNNVAAVFELGDAANLEGKHILLVDDVLTTGATLEVCAAKLLALANTKVSIAVIGVVKN